MGNCGAGEGVMVGVGGYAVKVEGAAVSVGETGAATGVQANNMTIVKVIARIVFVFMGFTFL